MQEKLKNDVVKTDTINWQALNYNFSRNLVDFPLKCWHRFVNPFTSWTKNNYWFGGINGYGDFSYVWSDQAQCVSAYFQIE